MAARTDDGAIVLDSAYENVSSVASGILGAIVRSLGDDAIGLPRKFRRVIYFGCCNLGDLILVKGREV